MVTTGRLIPRQRLQLIPRNLRLAHEYCYFLHDQCVDLLRQYEEANAHSVEVEFPSETEAKEFARMLKNGPFSAFRATSYSVEVKRVVLNSITMGMVSDCLAHLFEALKCFEKRKYIVALNLLRKPLMDSLLHLSWMFGDADAFYEAFTSGGPEALTASKLGDRRQEIIAKALANTQICKLVDATFIRESVFDARNESGLYGLFQHAVHLVTFYRPEVRTTPENFNFIFTNPFDDEVYEDVYVLLPTLLFYLSHIILGLFDRMKPMDEGAREAFLVRSTFGYQLVEGGEGAEDVQKALTRDLSPDVHCEQCGAPLVVTPHNAACIVLSDCFRCTCCQRIHPFPFSWLF